jgi:hypothetical protein
VVWNCINSNRFHKKKDDGIYWVSGKLSLIFVKNNITINFFLNSYNQKKDDLKILHEKFTKIALYFDGVFNFLIITKT